MCSVKTSRRVGQRINEKGTVRSQLTDIVPVTMVINSKVAIGLLPGPRRLPLLPQLVTLTGTNRARSAIMRPDWAIRGANKVRAGDIAVPSCVGECLCREIGDAIVVRIAVVGGAVSRQACTSGVEAIVA